MPEDLVRLGCRAGIAVCLVLAPTACGDDGATTPGGTGSVEVTTATTGEGLDADGYVVEIVGGPSLTVGINATATLSEVPAGDVEIRLTGVRGNCTVQSPHPRLLRLARNETFRTRFDVGCADTPLLGRIVFHSRRDGDLELYTMNPDGSDPVRLTNTPYDGQRYLLEFDASVSPDGSRILFAQSEGPEVDMSWSEVFVMNADGSDRENLTNRLEGDDFQPSWSPDGSQIAFLRDAEQGYDIWVMNADGSGQRNVTSTPTEIDQSPAWSPDGTQILYSSSDGEDLPHLEIIAADGSGRRRLTEGASAPYGGTWSPDGSRIAFVRFEENVPRLYTMAADGSDVVALTPEGTAATGPASWSPAGDRLVFTGIENEVFELYVIGADGTGMINISNTAAFEGIGPQAWGP